MYEVELVDQDANQTVRGRGDAFMANMTKVTGDLLEHGSASVTWVSQDENALRRNQTYIEKLR